MTAFAPLPVELQLEFAVHELTGTFRGSVADTLALLPDFGINLAEVFGRGGMYRRHWVGEHGVTLQADNKGGSDELRLRVPGQACEHLGHVQLLSLATLLNLHVTRLDAAIDYCPFTPRHLLEAQMLGLTRTHAQAYSWHSNGEGDTFALGSRSSDVYLRCYDRRGFTRTELELKRGHARKFLAELMAREPDDWPGLFLGALRSHADFVDSGACENISRAPLLPFWRSFVGMFERVRLAPARVVAEVQKYVQHVLNVSSMFHVAVRVMARASGAEFPDVLMGLYNLGGERLKPRHELLIERGLRC